MADFGPAVICSGAFSLKYLIINGLHRSGTTMLERLLDSQARMLCFSHLWELPTLLGESSGSYKGAILNTDYSALVDGEGLGGLDAYQAKGLLLSGLGMYLGGLYGSPDYIRTEDEANLHIHGLPMSTYSDIFHEITKVSDAKLLRNPFHLFAKHLPDHKVIASKWTLAHRYSPVFLRERNTYWLEVVRNPKDRFSSINVSHKMDMLNSIQQSNAAFRFLESNQNPRMKVIRYEDVTQNTAEILKAVSEWIGEEISDVELTSPLGSPFRPNTSKNVIAGESFFWQNPNNEARIKSSDGEWRNKILRDGTDFAIDYLICKNPFYSPADYSLVYSAKGYGKLSRLYSDRILRKLGRVATRLARKAG